MPRLPPTATARSLSRTKAVDLPWTLPAASPPPCRRLGQDSAKPNPFFFLITLTARPAFPIQSRPVISGRVSGHLLKNLIFFYSTSFDQKPPKSSLWSEKINILVFSFGRFLWVIWADNKIAWQFFLMEFTDKTAFIYFTWYINMETNLVVLDFCEKYASELIFLYLESTSFIQTLPVLPAESRWNLLLLRRQLRGTETAPQSHICQAGDYASNYKLYVNFRK